MSMFFVAVVLSKKGGATAATRQMKEAMFEMAVRQDVYEERQNQLRWQVKLGEDQITPSKRGQVVDDRDTAWREYKVPKTSCYNITHRSYTIPSYTIPSVCVEKKALGKQTMVAFNDLKEVILIHVVLSQLLLQYFLKACVSLSVYLQLRRGDPVMEVEYGRTCTDCTLRRTRRDFLDVAPDTAKFDTYTNDMWAVRHAALAKFQQAARKVG